jgi:transposase
MIVDLPEDAMLIADKGYDADALRAWPCATRPRSGGPSRGATDASAEDRFFAHPARS